MKQILQVHLQQSLKIDHVIKSVAGHDTVMCMVINIKLL